MERFFEKENIAPATIHDFAFIENASPPKVALRAARSRSLGGPGEIENDETGIATAQLANTKNRRKSAFVATTKPILPKDVEKAARQAARRQTLANRRVSFAPEATLHTWDVIEFMRDHTTSTNSSEGGDTSVLRGETGSQQRQPNDKKYRRSSGIPPLDFNNPEDVYSSSLAGSDSESSGIEQEEESDGSMSEDETETAMSLDVDGATAQSGSSVSSTSSSARLDATLQQAALNAGTRGIHYDEFGEDMSMEIAGDTVTNAFKPWVTNAAQDPKVSQQLDQENVNPFLNLGALGGLAEGFEHGVGIIDDDDNSQEMSMDITHAVGGIVNFEHHSTSPPSDDATMEVTRALGRIHERNQSQSPTIGTGVKRQRPTTEAGTPKSTQNGQLKRRRSSFRPSVGGDATMDFTVAVGAIKPNRRVTRSSRGTTPSSSPTKDNGIDEGETSMDMTRAVGRIQASRDVTSHDENEQLTMELATAAEAVKTTPQEPRMNTTLDASASPTHMDLPATPTDPQRSGQSSVVSQSGFQTPVLQKSVTPPAPSSSAPRATSQSLSPTRRRTRSSTAQELRQSAPVQIEAQTNLTSPIAQRLSIFDEPLYPELPLAAQDDAEVYARDVPPAIPIFEEQRENTQLEHVEFVTDVTTQQQRQQPDEAPTTPTRTPQAQSPSRTQNLADSIKLMNTPRKETLRSITPRKQSSKEEKRDFNLELTTSVRSRNVQRTPIAVNRKPEIQATDDPWEKIQLHDFLEQAGIRFMDLTATKQRPTVAQTPSRTRSRKDEQTAVRLADAVVGATCTTPELEMYRHACNELRHSISDGRKIIKQLEAKAYDEPPPLIIAYQTGDRTLQAELDMRMRDIRTEARLDSKSAWYRWRGQLLSDLMQHLTTIGEGVLQDDEVVQHIEEAVAQKLPILLEREQILAANSAKLRAEATSMSAEQRIQVHTARERIVGISTEMQEKRDLLAKLQHEVDQQDNALSDLMSKKAGIGDRMREANFAREASLGVSRKEIARLKAAIERLEHTHGWVVQSARASPPTITLTYKSQLQLVLAPEAFAQLSASTDDRRNAPIKISYIGDDTKANSDTPVAAQFFLQGIQAVLREIPQHRTSLADLLAAISGYWDLGRSVIEAQRRLALETPITARIVSNDRLELEASVLFPKVRTKLHVVFELVAAMSSGLTYSSRVTTAVHVVYGEKYDETGMQKFVQSRIGDNAEGWETAVRDLMDKLIVQGPAKAART